MQSKYALTFLMAVIIFLPGCKKKEDAETTTAVVRDNQDTAVLMTAIHDGRTDLVKALLDKGADANAKDCLGVTALVGAIWVCDTQMAKMLLDSGADVNARSLDGFTALMEAACMRDIEIAKMLLDKGADVNAKNLPYSWYPNHNHTALIYAISPRGYSSPQGLTWREITKGTYKCVMSNAAERLPRSGLEMVKLLLDRGADVDVDIGDRGEATLVDMAIWEGDIEVVQLLLDSGASTYNKAKQPCAFRAAAMSNKPEILKFLLDRYEIDIKGDLLITAIDSRRTENVRILLDRGADINSKGTDGRTALIKAAYGGQTEAVKLLLDRGADINAKDKEGKTALMYAQEKGHKEIIELLEAAGAKE